MKIFKNRAVAWVVLVLAVVGSVCIGLSRKDSFLAKEPVALPEVEYQQWICDEADMLSDDTVAYITERNADWDAKYYAVVAVATADSIQGWTPEEAAKQLGADWKLGKNDMLLLMVRDDDYYVACGDSVLAVLNQYDTMQAKLKQSIEGLYYSGDFDGAAAAFFRQADVFYGQMAQMQPSGGYSNSYNSGGEWNAPAKTGSGGVSLGSVVLLIAAILVVWALLDRVRYNRYRRRYILGAPVNVVRPVYYPIFWGRHLRPRPPRSPRPPHGGYRPPTGGPRSPAPEQLSSATGQFPARRRFWRRQPGRRVRQWRLRRLSRRWKPRRLRWRRLRRRTPVTQLRKGAAVCRCAFCVNSYGVCGMETHYH